jgi:hypothetical protein
LFAAGAATLNAVYLQRKVAQLFQLERPGVNERRFSMAIRVDELMREVHLYAPHEIPAQRNYRRLCITGAKLRT